MNNNRLDKNTLELLIQQGIIKESDVAGLIKGKADSLLLHNVLDDYIEYLKQELGEASVNGYKSNLYKFLEWFYDEPIRKIPNDENIPMFTENNVSDWFKSLSDDCSYDTIRRHKYGIKKFFDYLIQSYNLNLPKVENIDISIPKNRDIDIIIYTHNEIMTIIECASTIKDQLIFRFTYETGMKRNEVVECKRKDIDLNNKLVTIRNKNGIVDRVSYISTDTVKLLLTYEEDMIEEVKEINDKRKLYERTKGRPYKEYKRSEYLFQTIQSPKIHYSTLHNSIKATAYEYFLNKYFRGTKDESRAKRIAEREVSNFTFETLRQSRRAYWFSVGKSVDEVQAIMGDENKWVTKKYIEYAQRIYPEKMLK